MKHLFANAYRKHFSETLLLAWPIILGQVGQMAMGIVDTAMVGRVNEQSVAAAGLANAVFMLFGVFGFGLAAAVSPLVSMASAKKDYAETAGILRGAYRAAVIISFIIMAILFWVTQNLGILKQEQTVELLAYDYLNVVIPSLLPMFLFMCAKQFSDGLSLTWPAMVITLLAIPANAFFNWLLIFGHWGFPELGLTGAGYGTLITRVLMTLAIITVIHKGKRLHPFVIQKPSKVAVFTKKVMAMGIPSGFQYFFEIAAFGGAMILAGWIGVFEQAAHQIAINVAALTYMVATGLSAAGGIRVGAAHGGFSKTEVRQAGKSAVLLGAFWMLISGVLMALLRVPIAGLFINEQAVLDITYRLLIIAALFQLSDGIQAICLGVLRGVADVKIPTAITLLAYWVIGLPVGYLLGFHTSLGIDGIWYGLLIGLSVSAFLLYRRFNNITR